MAMRKKGRYGEGSVFQHKSSGLWCAQLRVVGKDGKRSVHRAYCDRDNNGEKQASAILFNLRREMADHNGRLQSANRDYLSAFLTEWLEFKKSKIRVGTYADYELTLRKYLIPFIEKIKLGDFDEIAAEKLYVRLAKAKLTPRMIRKAHTLLHAAYNQGIKWRQVPRNPLVNVDSPKYKAPRQRALNDEQTMALLDAAFKTRFYALILLALDTGIRQGELFALRWTEVDLANGQVSIIRNLTYVGGKMSIVPPKTKAGIRDVQLSEAAVDALKAQKQFLFAQGLRASELVFPNSIGGYQSRSTFNQMYHAITKEAGLSIKFHELRHTAGTRMISSGIAPHAAAERLGHSDVSVTLGIYAHVQPKERQAAAATFDTVFNKRRIRG